MKGKKKILLAVALVLVMAVGITSIVVIRNRNKTVVKVFPVSMLNSSDWFDTDTSLTGTLTSDYIQEVHIDGGQKVKKVYVKKGDKVKPGDVLISGIVEIKDDAGEIAEETLVRAQGDVYAISKIKYEDFDAAG